MNVWLRLGVPALLGLTAAGINWQVLQSELEPHYFVKVTDDLKVGDPFRESKLERVSIRTDNGPGSLEKVAVPWNERSLLLDAPCVRQLKANDIVFRRDAPSRFKVIPLAPGERALQVSLEGLRYEPSLLMVGMQVGFVIDGEKPTDPDPIEGPFRILSVGRRVSPQAESDGDASGARIISIAVKTQLHDEVEVLEDKANRLLKASRVGNGVRSSGILGIVQYPSND